MNATEQVDGRILLASFEAQLRRIEATMGFHTMAGIFAVIEQPRFSGFVKMLESAGSSAYPEFDLTLADDSQLSVNVLQVTLDWMLASVLVVAFEGYLARIVDVLRSYSDSVQANREWRAHLHCAVVGGSDALNAWFRDSGIPPFSLDTQNLLVLDELLSFARAEPAVATASSTVPGGWQERIVMLRELARSVDRQAFTRPADTNRAAHDAQTGSDGWR